VNLVSPGSGMTTATAALEGELGDHTVGHTIVVGQVREARCLAALVA
jgi:hypothetical protein